MAASIPMERSYQDLEEWLAKLSQGMPLAESEVKLLCDLARETFLQESNVQPVSAPVTVCGDIHGMCVFIRIKRIGHLFIVCICGVVLGSSPNPISHPTSAVLVFVL